MFLESLLNMELCIISIYILLVVLINVRKFFICLFLYTKGFIIFQYFNFLVCMYIF